MAIARALPALHTLIQNTSKHVKSAFYYMRGNASKRICRRIPRGAGSGPEKLTAISKPQHFGILPRISVALLASRTCCQVCTDPHATMKHDERKPCGTLLELSRACFVASLCLAFVAFSRHLVERLRPIRSISLRQTCPDGRPISSKLESMAHGNIFSGDWSVGLLSSSVRC